MIGYVIGDTDMISGFRLVGVEGIEVATVDEARQALQRALTKSDVAIIIISQAYSTDPVMREQVDKVRQERVSPLIVELPGSKGPSKNIPISNTISKILGIKI
jgi:vacuolar-type H+-ATPase subunit F/Vma7